MTEAFLQEWREYISERTRVSLGALRDAGRVFGPTPYGYDRRDDILAANPDEQRIVAELRRGTWGATYRAMAAALNRAHIPTKHGATWYAATVRKILRGPIHDGG